MNFYFTRLESQEDQKEIFFRYTPEISFPSANFLWWYDGMFDDDVDSVIVYWVLCSISMVQELLVGLFWEKFIKQSLAITISELLEGILGIWEIRSSIWLNSHLKWRKIISIQISVYVCNDLGKINYSKNLLAYCKEKLSLFTGITSGHVL